MTYITLIGGKLERFAVFSRCIGCHGDYGNEHYAVLDFISDLHGRLRLGVVRGGSVPILLSFVSNPSSRYPVDGRGWFG